MSTGQALRLQIDLSARRPLRDEAYAVLRRAILAGQFKPGERLIEREIAAQMGLSRNPVREAFRRLEQERLVAVNRHGVVVQALDPREVEELYQIRRHLEVLAVQLAVRHFTPEYRRQLRNILQHTTRALADNDQAQVVELSIAFHRTIAEMSGNQRLARLVLEIGEEIQRFRSLNIQESTRTCIAVREHHQIFTALSRRDEKRAARLMAEHIERSWMHARRYLDIERR
jgi:DNA-binding GntR family transcriptional regulator